MDGISVKLLKDGGINFVLNFEVGKKSSLKKLREKHDAILIATGVYKPREVNIQGSNLKKSSSSYKGLKIKKK